MFWIIAIVLVILWGIGMITSFTLSGFIHILLIFAVISVLIQIIRGRRV